MSSNKLKTEGKNKDTNKNTNITTALIGAGATIIVAIIGLISTMWLQRQNTEVSIPTPNAQPLLNETFDNKGNWNTDPDSSVSYTSELEIKADSTNNKKLYHSIITTQQAGNDGSFDTIPVPDIIPTQNFCLIFDAKLNEATGSAGIVVIARTNNYNGQDNRSYYYLGLSEGNNGGIYINDHVDEQEKKIGDLSNDITWSDKKTHTVKISLIDGSLDIYDGNIQKIHLDLIGSRLLLDEGSIRLGVRVYGSGKQATFEFDNILIYDNRCP